MATIPTIHLNGTGSKTLYAEYHAAYKAVDAAIEALVSTTCNGRDFYPQGTDAFYQARDERDEALTKLRDAKAYVEQILMGIMDQM
jgi:hypothetical protein